MTIIITDNVLSMTFSGFLKRFKLSQTFWLIIQNNDLILTVFRKVIIRLTFQNLTNDFILLVIESFDFICSRYTERYIVYRKSGQSDISELELRRLEFEYKLYQGIILKVIIRDQTLDHGLIIFYGKIHFKGFSKGSGL